MNTDVAASAAATVATTVRRKERQKAAVFMLISSFISMFELEKYKSLHIILFVLVENMMANIWARVQASTIIEVYFQFLRPS